jgi:hypothetical protein
VEFSKNGFSISFGLDGGKLCGNDIEGINNLWSLGLSAFEVSMVLSSVFSELFLLGVEDFELFILVDDFSFKEVLGGGQSIDFVGGVGDFVTGEVNSSVVSIDFSFTFSFISSMLLVSFGLLKKEVFSEFLKHLGNVTEGALVLELEGNGIKEFSSHFVVLELFELSINAKVKIRSGFLDEDGTNCSNSNKKNEELVHLYLFLF